MTLRRTMALIILGTTLGLMATMFLVSRAIVGEGFRETEDHHAHRDIERAMNAIDVAVTQIEATTTDWAWWDATYEKGSIADPDYLAENLEGGSMESLGLDHLLILDRSGALVVGWGAIDEDRAGGELLRQALAPYLRIETAEAADFEAFSVSGLAPGPEGPVLFAARAILQSDGQGPARGVMVMSRALNDEAMAALGEQTVLELTLQPLDGDRHGVSEGRPVTIRALDGDTMLATGLLRDAAGAPAYALVAALPRDIAHTRSWVEAAMLAGVLITALVFGLIVFLLVERTVIRRLRALGAAASRIGREGRLHGRVPSRGSDEVAILAREINSMLALLEQTDERYQRLVDSALDAIMVVRDGRVVLANPAARALFGTDDTDAMSLETCLDEGAREGLGASLAATLRGEAAGHLEADIARADGTSRRVEFSFGRSLGPGSPSAQVIARDISERHRAEQERKLLEARMLETQRLESLGLLAGGIAHDFNNLMMAVLGSSEVARVTGGDAASVGEALDDIELAARRAADLTAQLLAYAGKGRLNLTVVDANRLANETASLMRRVAGRSTVFEVETDGAAPLIEGDATQLRQVLLNLVANAVDAAGGEGTVRVTTGVAHYSADDLPPALRGADFVSGEHAYIEVSDNGPGIPAEVRERMFEPFYSTKGKGRGLGLSAVLGIVRSHGGALMLDSGPGGTVVRAIFPLAKRAASPERVATPAVTSRRPLDVLVVDDDATVRRVTRAMFEARGDSVITAASGPEALGVLNGGQRSDLVMLDVTMPGMNGFEVLHRLRQTHPRLPVVVATGHSEEDMPPAVAADPGVRFLQKPFDLSTLGSVVGELIEPVSV